jgi:ubiquinone/menaquinone biosynthesis C-methylase UbiE
LLANLKEMKSMSSKQPFQDESYSRHVEHYHDYARGGKLEAQANTWLEKDTVDAWRHQRMYKTLDPILKAEPGAKWLTVGDGRYGNDANYILNKGGDVLATDISDDLLEEAVKLGHIREYRKENVEFLSFDDSQFDYVLCKESYHHFPRPMLALYEMLRVSKKGVILIEPNDIYINYSITIMLFRYIINAVKKLLKLKINKHKYEESGNYVFTISRREIEKIAIALNYKIIVFKGLNDSYIKGVESEQCSKKGKLYKKIRCSIYFRDLLCKIGFMDYKLLTAIILKQIPSNSLIKDLSKNAYEMVHLPANPYII